jgi:phosphoserine phosphatase RsbU/P
MIDPIKFRKILLTLLKVLVIVELIGAFHTGVSDGRWGRLGMDLILAGGLYIGWERVRTIIRDKKETYRQTVINAGDNLRLWDALIFSLLWTDEIYSDIPADRKRLIVIAYTLITLGLAAAYFTIGSGLMPLVISGTLVLGAVNLLAWVVSSESGEKRSLQTELQLAHDVQVSLMPKEEPDVPGYDIAGTSIPAKEVGGDHYTYSCLGSDESKFGISVFDVSGKGMQAAMAAVFTTGAFNSEISQSDSPARIVTRLNSAVYTHSKRGHFVAFMLAILDRRKATVTFSNAGQLKPLLKSGGSVSWLDSTGVHFPLGMMPASPYEESKVKLKPGDVLVLMTDGITEAMNAQQKQFENEGVERSMQEMDTARLSARQIVDMVIADVQNHTAGAAQHDDMTLVVMKVKQ